MPSRSTSRNERTGRSRCPASRSAWRARPTASPPRPPPAGRRGSSDRRRRTPPGGLRAGRACARRRGRSRRPSPPPASCRVSVERWRLSTRTPAWAWSWGVGASPSVPGDAGHGPGPDRRRPLRRQPDHEGETTRRCAGLRKRRTGRPPDRERVDLRHRVRRPGRGGPAFETRAAYAGAADARDGRGNGRARRRRGHGPAGRDAHRGGPAVAEVQATAGPIPGFGRGRSGCRTEHVPPGPQPVHALSADIAGRGVAHVFVERMAMVGRPLVAASRAGEAPLVGPNPIRSGMAGSATASATPPIARPRRRVRRAREARDRGGAWPDCPGGAALHQGTTRRSGAGAAGPAWKGGGRGVRPTTPGGPAALEAGTADGRHGGPGPVASGAGLRVHGVEPPPAGPGPRCREQHSVSSR